MLRMLRMMHRCGWMGGGADVVVVVAMGDCGGGACLPLPLQRQKYSNPVVHDTMFSLHTPCFPYTPCFPLHTPISCTRHIRAPAHSPKLELLANSPTSPWCPCVPHYQAPPPHPPACQHRHPPHPPSPLLRPAPQPSPHWLMCGSWPISLQVPIPWKNKDNSTVKNKGTCR